MSNDGEGFLYSIAGGTTGEYLGTGSLVAAGVVLVHDARLAEIGPAGRVRVQLLSADDDPEVVDGQVALVGSGLTMVALDRPATTPVAALRLGEKSSRDDVIRSLSDLVGEERSAAALPPPPGPPRPPSGAPQPVGVHPPGSGDDGPGQHPPWCPFEPTWPGCSRYHPH